MSNLTGLARRSCAEFPPEVTNPAMHYLVKSQLQSARFNQSFFPGRLVLAACVIVLGIGLSVGSAQDLRDVIDPLRQSRPGRARLNQPEVEVMTALRPENPKAGDEITLAITLKLPRLGHTYSMSKSFGGGTSVKFEAQEGVQAIGEFEADHPPEVEFSPEFKQNIEKFKKQVTWTRKYRVAPDAKQIRIQGILSYQYCDDTNCTMRKHPFEEEVAVAPAGPVTVPANPPPGNSARSSAIAVDPRFQLEYLPKHNHSKATLQLVPGDQDGEFILQLVVTLEEGWHTFSITQPEDNAAEPTSISVDELQGLIAIDAEFQSNVPPHVKKAGDKGQYTQEIFEKSVTWSRRFRLAPDTQLNDVKLSGEFAYQICKDSCIPAKVVEFEFPKAGPSRSSVTSATDNATAAPQESIDPPSPAPREVAGGPKIDVQVDQLPAESNPGKITAQGVTDLSDTECVASEVSTVDIRDQGLFAVVSSAFLFGLLALLTPCVFPMVPITVSFFLKESEKKHSSPVKLATVYCLSIVATFTVLGLLFSAAFGAGSINTLANGVALNLFLGLVLLFFSLNLLGLFDIQIPSWLLTFTASKESTGSYFGVFFMALTFTLTSFTCTFAFLGLILVWAANGQFWWPLMGLISFSTAFALPFFFLALFPSALRQLPRSGGWMNRVKVVMGLVEMAFMFKFLSVADISWNNTPTYLDYQTVMIAWIVISLIAAFYLLGKIRFSHDTVEEHTGVFPVLFAMGFLGLAFYLAVGVFSPEPPNGFLGKQIAAFAPPRFKGGVGEDGPYLIGEHDQLKYLLDIERAKQTARNENRPLFLDFTGVNCINCRRMEKTMAEAAVQQHLKELVRVQLYTDSLPKEAVADSKEGSKLVERNNSLAEKWYGSVELPSYAVVTPDGNTILSRIAGAVETDRFATFLKCGLNKWRSIQSRNESLTANLTAPK